MGIMIRFFDNVMGEVQTSFIKLEPVRKADAESLFEAINKNFCDSLMNYGWCGVRWNKCYDGAEEFCSMTFERQTTITYCLPL